LDNGRKTLVDLDAHIDPKGLLPAWLINFIQKKWPLTFLQNLEQYSKSHTFQPEKEFLQMLTDYQKKNPSK
jgi:hypothetical protein